MSSPIDKRDVGADGSIGVPDASELQKLRARGRFRYFLALFGAAFVAAVAYVDPGNFATNVAGGAEFGYMLLWTVLAANLMAMLIQFLSAKLGIATGKNLPELCRENFPRRVTWGLWAQAEVIAMATDLAEIVGAAIALNLLFGTPLFIGGLIGSAMAFVLLALITRGKRGVEHFGNDEAEHTVAEEFKPLVVAGLADPRRGMGDRPQETVVVVERISDKPLECLPLRIGKALAAAHLMPLKKRS